MSNRTLGFLIIFGFIAAGFLFYQYFFVFNLVSLTIDSNVDGYKVELKNIKSNKTQECLEKKCEILNLSPFEYSLKISKESYNDYTSIIKLDSSKNLNIKLTKKVLFEKVEENLKPSTEKTREQIIEEFKKTKDSYKIINLEDIGEFIFRELTGKLELFHLEKRLGTFPIVNEDQIDILSVVGSKNYILVVIGDDKYLINLNKISPNKINLKPSVSYVKVGNNLGEFDIVTEKGTYIYYLKDESLDYFSLFSDFVYVENGIIGIVDKGDAVRKKNFGYETKSSTLLVYINSSTNEKTILKELSFDVFSIFNRGDYIGLVSESGETYKLTNY